MSIRVGFFENFKGADTLLIDVNAQGLRDLVAWVREVIASSQGMSLSSCSDVSLRLGIHVEAVCAPDDAGLVRTADKDFVWQHSMDGWTDIADKLAAMQAGHCHQYLDGSRDGVQIVVSIGEYGDNWW